MAVDDFELLGLLEALIAVDSINPDLVPGAPGEGALAVVVGAWLAERGVTVTYQDVAPGRRNVIGRVRGGGDGPSLMLNTHLDTVGTAAMPDGLQPSIHGGRLYGRGAHDMKSGLAAAMVATAAAVSDEVAGDVILAAVVDEEGESKGTEALLRDYTADAGIVLEPTGHVIVPVHKGFVWADVETHGVAAHGSDADRGVDAILGMGHVLVELDLLAHRLRTRPAGLAGTGSLHASLISGGLEVPTYPDRCSVVVERRTVPGESAEQVLAELDDAVAAARAGDIGSRWSGRVSLRLVRLPLATPEDSLVVTTLRHACERVLGSAKIGVVAFWTDAALMSAAGIPSVVFGVQGEGMHSSCEWVELASVRAVADVITATVRRLCG